MIRILFPLVPALVAFGPLFIVMGLQPSGMIWVAYVGAMMTYVGVLCVFGLLCSRVRELKRLNAQPAHDKE